MQNHGKWYVHAKKVATKKAWAFRYSHRKNFAKYDVKLRGYHLQNFKIVQNLTYEKNKLGYRG